jgi:hypothetical protein
MMELTCATWKSPLQAKPQNYTQISAIKDFLVVEQVATFHTAINDTTERELYFLNPSTDGGWN